MESMHHPLKTSESLARSGRRISLLERVKPLLPFTLKDTGLLPELRTHLFHPYTVAWVFRLLIKDEPKVDAADGVPVVLEGELPPYKLDIPIPLVK